MQASKLDADFVAEAAHQQVRRMIPICAVSFRPTPLPNLCIRWATLVANLK
jgi:hypothetical protein